MTTQTTEVPIDAHVRDFSVAQEPLTFRIDEDVFTGPSVLPAQRMIDFASRYSDVTDDMPASDQLAAIHDSLRMVLHRDSADRFIRRMSNTDHPISLKQVTDIVAWLLEEHGMRPTQPSSDSSPGLSTQETGTPSTDGVPSQESTSGPSVWTGS